MGHFLRMNVLKPFKTLRFFKYLGRSTFITTMFLSLWGCMTTSQRSTYTIAIRPGDTLAGLAQKYDTSPVHIMRLNGLKKPVMLRVGQKLLVAPGPLGLAAGQGAPQAPLEQNGLGSRRAGATRFSRGSPVADPSEFKDGDFPGNPSKTAKNPDEGGALDLDLGDGGAEPNGGRRPTNVNAVTPDDARGHKSAPRPKKGLFFGSSRQPESSSIEKSIEKSIDEEFEIQRDSDLSETGGLDALALEPMRWPLRGSISSHFGSRHGKLHRGVDLKAPHGSPLWASAEGTVVFSGLKKGYGKVVIIQHRYYQTLYAHLSAIRVKAGEWVDLKKVIGKVGATGNARGTHLHFEVMARFDQPMDPVIVMTRSQSIRVAAAKAGRSSQTRIQ
jgi:murein DD-endopeptidase MepM/ murein hydrolase activator NlpD